MKKGVLLISTLIICLVTNAQIQVVNGHVYAFKDLRLKNIKVEAKKSGAAVLTDSLGNFNISCNPKDKLIFTGNGFRKFVKSTNKRNNNLQIKMVMLEGAKHEEVAVGFNHVSRYEINDAIAHYSAFNNDYGNYTDIFELIRGKFAGVEVVGQGTSKNILVRGVSSTSNNYAIYVVNGVQMPSISHIEPILVKSIDVIKDGNAFYGSLGANGVVLITTNDQPGH